MEGKSTYNLGSIGDRAFGGIERRRNQLLRSGESSGPEVSEVSSSVVNRWRAHARLENSVRREIERDGAFRFVNIPF